VQLLLEVQLGSGGSANTTIVEDGPKINPTARSDTKIEIAGLLAMVIFSSH
jgi:hypothetical protein